MLHKSQPCTCQASVAANVFSQGLSYNRQIQTVVMDSLLCYLCTCVHHVLQYLCVTGPIPSSRANSTGTSILMAMEAQSLVPTLCSAGPRRTSSPSACLRESPASTAFSAGTGSPPTRAPRPATQPGERGPTPLMLHKFHHLGHGRTPLQN